MKVFRAGDTIITVCTGLGNAQQSLVLNRLVESQMEEGLVNLIIDLEHCDGIDSSFAGTLVGIVQLLAMSHGHVILNKASCKVLKILQELGIAGLLLQRDEEIERGLEAVAIQEEDFTMGARIQLIKKAHENLIAAETSNQERFGTFLDALKEEMRHLPPP